MKFNSFDELINYLYGKDLSALEFEITEVEKAECDGACNLPDSSHEPVSTDKKVSVVFNSLSDRPVVEFAAGEQSVLVVDNFEHIPNTCSTTKVKLFDRELTIGVCENENGQPVAKFDVIINEQFIGNKEFVLVTDSDKYTNTISI